MPSSPYHSQTAAETEIDTTVTNETSPGGITAAEMGSILKKSVASGIGGVLTSTGGTYEWDVRLGRRLLLNANSQTLRLSATGLSECEGLEVFAEVRGFTVGGLGPQFVPAAGDTIIPTNGSQTLLIRGIVRDHRIYCQAYLVGPGKRYYNFDGTNDYGTVAHHSSLNFGTGTFTMMLLFTPTNVLNRRILSKRSAAGGDYWELLINSSNQVQLLTSSGAGGIGAGIALTADVETMVVISRDGSGVLRCNCNGTTASASGNGASIDNSEVLQVCRHYTDVQHYAGKIFALQLSGSAVDVTDTALVAKIRAQKSLPNADKLWFDCRETSGTTLTDRSDFFSGPGTNNATLVNTTAGTFFGAD